MHVLEARKLALLVLLASLAAGAACTTGTAGTSTTGAPGSEGGAPGGNSPVPLPIGCTEQAPPPGQQYCEASETLVACKAGAEPGCKRSALPGSYCCATSRPPAPKPSAQVIAFCEAQSRCPNGPSNPLSCEDKLTTHASFVGCRDTYEALHTCILQPGVDPCALATATPPCLDELTAYFSCHVKPENPNCVPSASATERCNARTTMSEEVGSIGFTCPNQPYVFNDCSSTSFSMNGGATEYFACCAPNGLFQ